MALGKEGKKQNFCPVCGKEYRTISTKAMVKAYSSGLVDDIRLSCCPNCRRRISADAIRKCS